MTGAIPAALCRGFTGLALSFAVAAPALAQDEPAELPDWYIGPFLTSAIPDPSRRAKSGLGPQLVVGKALADGIGIEGALFRNAFNSQVAGGADSATLGAGLDLVLGQAEPGRRIYLIGAGMVQHEVAGLSETEPYASLGVGYYVPFARDSGLWRLEARYRAIFTSHPALPDESMVGDFSLGFGLMLPFGELDAPPPAPAAAVAEAAPLEPAATALADEDGDGVPEASDRCPGTAPNAKVDDQGCVLPEDIVLGPTEFGSDSASITADGYGLLRTVAAAMKASPQMKLEVGGHTDASGNPRSNLALSTARARAVHDFLVSLGVDHRRMTVKGYGTSQPVNDNSTLELRAYNRRVQFRRLDTP